MWNGKTDSVCIDVGLCTHQHKDMGTGSCDGCTAPICGCS